MPLPEEGKEIYGIKCRPSQTNPSAEKAELFAILQELEKSSSTIKLSVYTDSQNSITSINELDRNPSERNIIKIDDYPIVKKINHELKRFETRPVFKKGSKAIRMTRTTTQSNFSRKAHAATMKGWTSKAGAARGFC
jgi:ribonuclease HI